MTPLGNTVKEENKYNLIKRLIATEDTSVLQQIKAILDGQDYWESLPSQVKETINQSVREGDKGLGVPHEEVMKAYRQKYGHE